MRMNHAGLRRRLPSTAGALALLACLSACVHPQPKAPATPPEGRAPPPAPLPAQPVGSPAPVTAPPAAPATPATPPPSAATAAAPPAPAPPKAAKPVAPASPAAAGKTAPDAASQSAAPAGKPAPARVGPPSLDLPALEQRLRDTRAIGVFTKLSLKNQVDDLLGQFRAYHKGQPKPTLAELRQHYELLLLKVVTLLQDGDAPLASAVSSSREAIWLVLTDPKKFAQI
jgi:hypothetical protein